MQRKSGDKEVSEIEDRTQGGWGKRSGKKW